MNRNSEALTTWRRKVKLGKLAGFSCRLIGANGACEGEMDFLEKHCRKVYAGMAAAKRAPYKLALREALKLDFDYCDRFPFRDDFAVLKEQVQTPPQVATPERIQRSYGFGLLDQSKFSLSLTRPRAHEFISEMTSIGKAKFDRQFTVGYYVEKFGRQPTVMPYQYGEGRDPIMLLTYAEWLHLVGLSAQPPLPELDLI